MGEESQIRCHPPLGDDFFLEIKVIRQRRAHIDQSSLAHRNPHGTRDEAKMPKPRALLLRVSARPNGDPFDGIVLAALAVEACQHLGVSHRFARLAQERSNPAQPLHFIRESRRDHRLDSRIDAAVDLLYLPLEPHDAPSGWKLADPCTPFDLMRGQRPPRELRHLEGANRAPPIVDMDSTGSFGVDGRQSAAKDLQGFLLKRGTNGLIGPRKRRQPVDECANVEVGTTNHDRQPAACVYVGDRLPRTSQPVSNRRFVPMWIGDVDHVVRNCLALHTRCLRRANVHALVHLHRIGADDFRWSHRRQLHGKRGLPASRGAHDEQRAKRGLGRVEGHEDARIFYGIMAKRFIDDVDVRGKRVFVRADFNVPIEGGRISDDRRIRLTVPTLTSILSRGGSVVVASHMGRPEGKGYEAGESMEPVRAHLEQLLGRPVRLVGPTPTHADARAAVLASKPGDVILLENLRFEKAEKKGCPDFAKQLAEYGDIYCNDAFGACHRTDSSMHALPLAMAGKPRVVGHLLRRELQYLQGVLDHPARPFVAILGGAKVSDKLPALRNLLDRVDTILVGGAMAFTFLRAKGLGTGASRVEPALVDDARAILELAAAKGISFHLPSDFVCAQQLAAGVDTVVEGPAIPDGWMGLDIGPRTLAEWASILSNAGTVMWNGPVGAFETPPFDAATFALARACADRAASGGIVVAGGGDTAAAVAQAGVADRFSHVSTGGGASLEMMEGKAFVTLDSIEDASELASARV